MMNFTAQLVNQARRADRVADAWRRDDDTCDRSRILIVDDEEAMRKLHVHLVSNAFPSLAIECARNGAEAVDVFSVSHPAVLLMDLHMPIMDGKTAYEIMCKICLRRDWEAPCAIFCSGFIPSEEIRRALTWEGRYAVLTKPVNPDRLTREISLALTRTESHPPA